jgi:uncharacterized damage-inducible protein DinB
MESDEMRASAYALAAALCAVPALATAQGMNGMSSHSANPVADALRGMEHRYAQNLTGALEAFPADKYGYKPTDAQMTVGQIAVHLAEGNDSFCATLGGVAAPHRSKVSDSDTKDALMARLRETFQFCETALASATDAKAGEEVPFFGGRKTSWANLAMVTVGDWADHYSQLANYLRLNNLLPPTARRGM